MTDEERAELDAAIRQRHGTPHRFCKHSGLPRGTVYQVLAGRYAGNSDRQVERIRIALLSPDVTGERIGRILRRHACARCLSRGSDLCGRCEPVFAAQAAALLDLFRTTKMEDEQ